MNMISTSPYLDIVGIKLHKGLRFEKYRWVNFADTQMSVVIRGLWCRYVLCKDCKAPAPPQSHSIPVLCRTAVCHISQTCPVQHCNHPNVVLVFLHVPV